jgi:hypothetical protein
MYDREYAQPGNDNKENQNLDPFRDDPNRFRNQVNVIG